MVKYPKIQTVYLRDPENNMKTLLEGQFSLPEFEFLQDVRWEFTEKVDGTNIRVQYNPYPLIKGVEFRGKTDNAEIPTFLLDRLIELFPLSKMEKTFVFDNIEDDELPMVTLYGEGYGPKIQKGGGKYRSDPSFVLFDVKIDKWWLKRQDVDNIAMKLGIESVPIVGHGSLSEMVGLVKAGLKSRWGNFFAEGIVARPEVELFDRSGKRIITKLKYKDFKRV